MTTSVSLVSPSPAISVSSPTEIVTPVGTVANPLVQLAQGGATIATGQISVGLAATQIVPARAGRISVSLTNLTGSQVVSLGISGVSVASAGMILTAAGGSSVTIPTQAAIFGITVTLAQTVAFMENF